ncbi:hypothetical protein FS837_000737, partial [Tulasnella sp. UAMH 9824]
AIWLSLAYRLEFLGEQVYLPLWMAGAVFLVANNFVLVKLIQAGMTESDMHMLRKVLKAYQFLERNKRARM